MFSDVNDFRENDFFSGVWLHPGKCFGKYFGHFRVSRCFGHIIGSRVILISLEVSISILVIWKFWRYFGHFGISRYFGHFIGSRVILVILKVLELFWSFC
jgi:hypothetical protein